MKILMKKRSFVKVEMAGLLGVKVPCLMPNRVKTEENNNFQSAFCRAFFRSATLKINNLILALSSQFNFSTATDTK